MSNKPIYKTIYLTGSLEGWDKPHWCQDRIEDDDIPYIRADTAMPLTEHADVVSALHAHRDKLCDEHIALFRRMHKLFGFDHGDDVQQLMVDRDELLIEIGVLLDDIDRVNA